MPTAVISDLHLGTLAGADVLRTEPSRESLLEALADYDRIVLLGDTLELREQPTARILEATRPFFEALGEVTAGKRVTLVAGNHDNALADPFLERLRLDGVALGPAQEWPVEPGDGIAGRLAALLGGTEVTFAYPGLWLRPDVYATHGHYLDVHLTIPRPESVIAHGMARAMGHANGSCASAADHETVLAPMYAFYGRMAEGASQRLLGRTGGASRAIWRRMNHGEGGSPLGRALLARVAIPGAVAALNGLGLGPLKPEITGEELRRSGLAAIGRVVDGMGVDAEHVVFGHTHRSGPLPGDDLAEWDSPRGVRLHNTGNWCLEPELHGVAGAVSPYTAGTFVHVGDDGPPELIRVLGA